jgi:hypothetical protein
VVGVCASNSKRGIRRRVWRSCKWEMDFYCLAGPPSVLFLSLSTESVMATASSMIDIMDALDKLGKGEG